MNQWNQLADVFGGSWDEGEIPECVADNICIAWPSILKCIDIEFPESRGNHVLDYGCGGGLFCRKLSQIGFSVTGYDESHALIKSANLNTSSEVIITSSNLEMVKGGKYDLVSSIMVFQFIMDIESTIDSISSIIKPGGLVIFAVFNPRFIEENSGGDVFSGFDSYQTGYMALKEDLKIPVYNRNEDEYREMFVKNGFEEVYLDYPEFTKEFLDRHKMPFSTRHSEYQIQGFRYKNT